MAEAMAPPLMADPQADSAPPGPRRIRLPMPYPDPVAARLNRWRALASSPRRLLNYIRSLRAKRSPSVHYLPTRLDIENVSRCNFHCVMCQVSDWPGLKRAEDMSLEDFKRLIDSQYGLLEIKLQGMGEPLLGRETYFEMIRYARSKHIWVRTTTNASLLHFKDNYKTLIDTGVNEVQISFDGATKETFEKIRRGSTFELVVNNCKLVNDYCNQRRLLRTRMWVVVQQSNVHEFLQFVDLAHTMGFKRLTYSLNLTDFGQEKWHRTNGAMTVEESVTPELAREAMERGHRLGVEVTFWHIFSKYGTERSEALCPWPFERAYVSSDLRIVPCCMIANPEVVDLGDARDFTTAWNDRKMRAFRRLHLTGSIPKVCQSCYRQREADGKPVQGSHTEVAS